MVKNQFNYIEKILQKYGFTECRSVHTPINPGVRLSINDSPKISEEKEIMAKYLYNAVIGSLMFLAIRTRPDILCTVTKLNQFIENPGYVHWKGIMHMLRYLNITKSLQLHF